MTMIVNSTTKSTRCLYHSTISEFIQSKDTDILGELVFSYHVYSLTTTNESWK